MWKKENLTPILHTKFIPDAFKSNFEWKNNKLVKDNIGEYFHNFETGKDFLNGV